MHEFLQPGAIGPMQLKNRIIYPGMTFKVGDNHGHLTDAEVNSMVYRAQQEYGPGLVTFPGLNDTMFGKIKAVNVNDDEAMYTIAKHVERVKVNDTKAMAILGVLGLRKSGDYTTRDNLGPSDMGFPYETKEITREEIQFFIEKFSNLALRAKMAGFDAMRIQTDASKKLLGLFISPYANRRTDEYGGPIENRARIVVELLTAIRKKVGNDMAIVLNVQMEEWFNYGTTLEDGIAFAKLVAPYVDAYEPVAFSRYKGGSLHGEPYYVQSHGPLLPYARTLKEVLPDKTVVASIRMGSPQLMEDVIKNKDADFISLGRPLFADPKFVEKIVKGQTQDISHCVGCMNCYTDTTRKSIYPTCHRACTVNPANLREEEYYTLKPAESPKKILVAGGGLAGMEAAWVLAARGHDVTLCEQSGALGGQWIPASCGEEKSDYRTLIPHKQRQLAQHNVKVCLNTTVDRAYLEEHKPDVTIMATGAVPRHLSFNFPLGDVQVVQGNDVLTDTVEVGDEVVVVGGRYIGMSVAAKLAKAGHKVTVVDMQELGKGLNPKLYDYYVKEMLQHDVRMFYNTQVVSFTPSGVDLMCAASMLSIPAKSIVLAAGTIPCDGLKKDLQALGLRHCIIGDCKGIGDALYAIRDGAEIGRAI